MRYNLSEVNGLIKDRRTIYPKDYSDRKVQKEIIESILNNAIWAPTHGKTQPWRFRVYMNEGRQKLSDLFVEQYQQHTSKDNFRLSSEKKLKERPLQASVVIGVWMERQKEEQIPEIEEIAATACAIQNMLLTATGYGIGSFWSTPKFIYSESFRNVYGIGPNDRMVGFVYLGYPEIEWPKGQRKPIEYLTEWIEE